MTYKQVKTMIAGFGLPYAYNQFPNGTEQTPPFICFMFDNSSDDLMADNMNYQAIRPLTIELYTDNKDFEKEATIETALKSAGLSYVRDETYIESEKMFQITYDTEVIIDG